MSRTQLILGGLLVVQLALIALFRSPFADAHAPTEAQPLLPDLDAAATTRLELTGGEGAVTIVRQGDDWVVDELGGFPADSVKVQDLLDTLGGLEVREPVVTSSRHHDNLQIADDENEGRVRLLAGDDVVADLLLGSSPNYRMQHLRRAGEDAVYEVRGLAAYDVRPETSAWARKELIDLNADEVSGVVVENAGGSFELARDDEGWKLVAPASVDGAVDPEQVDSLIRAVASLRITDPVGATEPDHGLDTPVAKVVLRTADGEVRLSVGATVPDNASQRFVTRDGFGFTGTIWESSVKAVLDRTVDELLAG